MNELTRGQEIGPYRIIERLGQGGMGTVYRAEDTQLRRSVALKHLRPDRVQNTEAKKRFTREANVASTLDHPNICKIYEIIEHEGEPLIAMEYCDGENLQERIEAGLLSIVETVEIAHQIANGLTRAHAKSVVHRDIKPTNVIVTKDEGVKLVDFGIAKVAGAERLTSSGLTPRTPLYSSPEQIKSKRVDTPTDLWSLGVVLYQMLTGALPFDEPAEILHQEPSPLAEACPEVPKRLEHLVHQLLSKNPESRPTIIETVEILARIREDPGDETTQTDPRSPIVKQTTKAVFKEVAMNERLRFFQYILSVKEETLKTFEHIFSAELKAEDRSLSAWYAASEQRWIRFVVNACLLTPVAGLVSLIIRQSVPSVSEYVTLGTMSLAIYLIESFVIFIFTVNIVIKPNPTNRYKNEVLRNAADAAKDFLDFWPFLWVAWFVLYVTLLLRTTGVIESLNLLAFLNFCNNLSGVVMLSMYIELAKKTQYGDGRRGNRIWIPALMFLVIIVVIELISLKVFVAQVEDVVRVASLISGIMTGTITGLLIARLTSRTLAVPLSAIVGLTVYAVFQPVFPLISDPVPGLSMVLALIFTALAFYAKILLFIVIHWIRDTDRLLYYMVREAKLHEEEDEKRFRLYFQHLIGEIDAVRSHETGSDQGTSEVEGHKL